jgi:hypothetical protein
VYLGLRNANHPSDVLLHLGALTVVAGGALTVRLLAMLLPAAARPGASVPRRAEAEEGLSLGAAAEPAAR